MRVVYTKYDLSEDTRIRSLFPGSTNGWRYRTATTPQFCHAPKREESSIDTVCQGLANDPRTFGSADIMSMLS